ncbi:MAG: sulfite exporter TauE/SafE family protein [Candidatus Hinthialibacter antarcticus]|nr:sulfite exporter TauE/SafE family protein [Candidatus Hinthialibacter antarcticus]
MDLSFWLLAASGVILIGIAKAGFGGGVGIAAVPLFIYAVGDSKAAVGMMLPILCACDLFSLIHYRKTFDIKNLIHLLPGVVIGITLASFFIGRFSNEQMKFGIGVISILFVVYQLGKAWIMKELTDYKPKAWHGWLFGAGVGLTSTFAHAAGPVATMYLFPQNLGRQLYVGTTVVLFTIVNALKLVPFAIMGLISLDGLSTSAMLLPIVPIGTLLGVWMNKHMNETAFNSVIYVVLFLVGLQYTTGFNFVGKLLGV